MEWYHAAGLLLGLASLALLAAVYWRIYARDRRERDSRKAAIRDAIHDAEPVILYVPSLSRDYDYMDEAEASERIASYARENTPRIERSAGEIRRHSLYLDGGDPLRGRVKEALAALDWFIATYGNDGEPSISQRVDWRDDRENIHEKIDQIRAVAKSM